MTISVCIVDDNKDIRSALEQIVLMAEGYTLAGSFSDAEEALLKIPMGQLSTYGSIAEKIEKPGASRAVGTAIGSNPVAFLIPCHRVIQSTGVFGGYMWGNTRKTAIIGWEGAKVGALV